MMPKLIRLSLRYKHRPQPRRTINPKAGNAEFLGWVTQKIGQQEFSIKRRILDRLFGSTYILVKSFKFLRMHGDYVFQETGKTKLQQLYEIIKICRFMPARPTDYYNYEWYKVKDQNLIQQYLTKHRGSGNCAVVKALIKDSISKILVSDDNFLKSVQISNADLFFTDKDLAAAWMKTRGYPVAKSHGKYSQGDALPPLTGCEFVAKPNFGSQGKGILKVKEENGYFKLVGRDVKYSPEQFQEMLTGKMRKSRDYFIFEETLKNHPEIFDLTGNALATCRIITLQNELKISEIVGCMFRFSSDFNGWIDNASDGGIAVPVDIENGTLGNGCNLSDFGSLQRYPRHPITNVQINGRKLPFWQEVKDLCLKAHNDLYQVTLCGWDVAITKDGPFIVEVNRSPGVEAMQRCHQKPFGPERYGELLVYNVKQVLHEYNL